MESKLCPSCSVTKSGESFYLRSDGTLNSYCKECQKVKSLISGQKLRLIRREAKARYRASLPPRPVRLLKHRTKGQLDKALVLGMSIGRARGILVKAMMYSMAARLNLLQCYRCHPAIATPAEFSIDHKRDWLKAGPEAYFALDNIAFSHLHCNSAASSGKEALRNASLRRRYRADGLRFCGTCRSFLESSSFNRETRRVDGLSPICKGCKKRINGKRNRRQMRKFIASTSGGESIATLRGSPGTLLCV